MTCKNFLDIRNADAVEFAASMAGAARRATEEIEEIMSYDYQRERPKLFTEDGQVAFLKIRDNVKWLVETAGAFQAEKAWKNVSGDSWQMLACLDRLVELGEIVEVAAGRSWAQYRIFTGPVRS